MLCENDQELAREVSHDDPLQSALLFQLGVLRDTDENDVMRQLLGSALQMLVDAEATAHIGAAKHERTTQRNSTRDKTVATGAGHVTVKIPKTRTGSLFASGAGGLPGHRGATGVNIDGRRENLGHAVGDSESGPFWTYFLRSLRDRGLAVASDRSPLVVS